MLTPLTSQTTAPNVRGLARRNADWRCVELLGFPSDSALSSDGASSLTKPSQQRRGTPLLLFFHQWSWKASRSSRSTSSTTFHQRRRRRGGVAASRGLDHVWRESLKRRLYAASVCSTMTYGGAWTLIVQSICGLALTKLQHKLFFCFKWFSYHPWTTYQTYRTIQHTKVVNLH